MPSVISKRDGGEGDSRSASAMDVISQAARASKERGSRGGGNGSRGGSSTARGKADGGASAAGASGSTVGGSPGGPGTRKCYQCGSAVLPMASGGGFVCSNPECGVGVFDWEEETTFFTPRDIYEALEEHVIGQHEWVLCHFVCLSVCLSVCLWSDGCIFCAPVLAF